jgi:molecular chaperone Hsp33
MEKTDYIVRAVAADDTVKMAAVTARGIVERARQIHGTSPVATAALGRALCAVSLLGDMLKETDATVTLRLTGGGPLGSVLTVSDSGGNVRGYVRNPEIELPLRPDGKLDVGRAVGKDGLLTVSRDLGLREPYIGSTKLVSGEIGEDLAAHLTESDQVGSACGLGVLVGTDRSVAAAGGFIIQLLPGAPEELIDRLEKNIAAMGMVTDILREGTPELLTERALAGLRPRTLDKTPVEYRCYCSRERVLAAVSSISREDLRELTESGEDAVVSCQFCDTVYRFPPEELSELLKSKDNAEDRGDSQP